MEFKLMYFIIKLMYFSVLTNDWIYVAFDESLKSLDLLKKSNSKN